MVQRLQKKNIDCDKFITDFQNIKFDGMFLSSVNNLFKNNKVIFDAINCFSVITNIIKYVDEFSYDKYCKNKSMWSSFSHIHLIKMQKLLQQ